MATKKKDQVEQQQDAVQTPEQAPQAATGLTLQDLILVAQVIQLTSQRGAFRAEEMEQVGGLYNKLIGFLESTGAISRPAPEAPQEN